MDYTSAFQLWRIAPPPWFEQLRAISDEQQLCFGASLHAMPTPFFTPQEIANAHAVLADWDIASHFVPVAGDFHDVLCIDAATPDAQIVLLNDARQELARLTGYDDLQRRLQTAPPGPTGEGTIVYAWFGF